MLLLKEGCKKSANILALSFTIFEGMPLSCFGLVNQDFLTNFIPDYYLYDKLIIGKKSNYTRMTFVVFNYISNWIFIIV